MLLILFRVSRKTVKVETEGPCALIVFCLVLEMLLLSMCPVFTSGMRQPGSLRHFCGICRTGCNDKGPCALLCPMGLQQHILPWMSLNFERHKQEVCTPHAEPAEVGAAPKARVFLFWCAVFTSQNVNVVHDF